MQACWQEAVCFRGSDLLTWKAGILLAPPGTHLCIVRHLGLQVGASRIAPHFPPVSRLCWAHGLAGTYSSVLQRASQEERGLQVRWCPASALTLDLQDDRRKQSNVGMGASLIRHSARAQRGLVPLPPGREDASRRPQVLNEKVTGFSVLTKWK